jgi:hypothetical protein
MDAARYAARSAELSWREVAGEVVILDLRSQAYLSLNGTGASLWRVLQGGATAAELSRTLIEQHGAPEEVADRDSAAFVQMLDERGLLGE